MPYELFLALRYLVAKRKQTFFSLISLILTLGITVGVAFLIGALALATGFQDEIRSKILGANAHLTIFAGWGGGSIEDPAGVMESLADVPEVVAVAPLVLEKGLVVSDLNPRGDLARVRGIDPAAQPAVTELLEDLARAARRLEIEPARPEDLRPAQPAADGIAPRRATVFLGHELARTLGVGVGDRVRLVIPQVRMSPFSLRPKAAAYDVAGITETGYYEYDTTRVTLHVAEAQRLFGMRGAVSAVQARIRDLKALDDVRPAVQARLGDAFWVTDLLHQNRFFFSALRLEKLVAGLIISVIILVAALNIVSTLILMVMEKVRDIGILVSMGASSRGVMALFLLKGGLIGVAGTTLGCGLGTTFAWVMNRHRLWRLDPDVYFLEYVPFDVRPLEFVLVAVVALIISFLATLYPAWRASRLDPVEALRYE